MMLFEAIRDFIDYRAVTAERPPKSNTHAPALELLKVYFARDVALDYLTPARLRDFLARWYIAEASCPTSSHRAMTEQSQSQQRVSPEALIEAMAQFIAWAGERTGSELAEACIAVTSELEQSLPRAMKITAALSLHLAEGGGPVGFPEFLTSFEEGGHSSYDVDLPAEVGALDGRFQVLRVEGPLVEALDSITDERVWPIIFPDEVARLISPDYIIELEIVRAGEGWKVAGCGFTYPPGTKL